MDTTNVNILFWDDKSNFDLESTQTDLGIFEGQSIVYKKVLRFFEISEIDLVLKDVEDNEHVFILCHIHVKGLKGYKKFKTLLKKYPNLKNSFLYVSGNREAHKQFYDDTGNNERIFTYSVATKEIEDMEKIPTKRELLQLKSTEQLVAKNHVELIEEKIYPAKIAEGIEKFKADHSGKKTAFIMTSFSGNHTTIIREIKKTLEENNIVGLIATDKEYEEDLFPNIQVYMYCCDFGIGVFTKIDNAREFNPNLSVEVGYMMGLGKNVCYLKEKQSSKLDTDLLSKLYKEFDALNLDTTLPQVIGKWLQDKGII